MKGKARLAGVLVLVVTLLLAAGSVWAKKVTLHYWVSLTPEQEKIEQEIVQGFEAIHPNIDVELLNVPWSGYHDKIVVASATGLDLDVFQGSSAWTRQFALDGLIENLQPYFDRDLNLNDYYAAALLDSRVPATPAGDLYGLNPVWVGNIVYYNKNLFDEGGVGYPEMNSTWQDMESTGRKLTKDKNGDGEADVWGLGNMAWNDAGTFWWENGGAIFNEDYTRSLLDSPEVVEATQYLKGLYDVGIVGRSATFYGGVKSDSNIVAYDIDGSYLMSSFMNLPFDWDVSVVPVKEAGGPRYAYAGNNPYQVWSKSEHKSEAWEFVKYRASAEVLEKHPIPGQGPTLKALGPGSSFWQQDWMPEHYMEVITETAGAYHGYAWGAPNWSEWLGVVAGGLTDILTGEEPVKNGLDRIAHEVTVIANRGADESK